MESLTDKMEIQEKDLELVISKQTLGSLTTNAKDIKALVEKALPNYDVANYNESNIELAKKDKAMLNKASKALNDKRLELEKEFVKPFAEFKDIINDTIKLIGECSSKIDSVVKESEQKEKDAKKKVIEDYFTGLDFTLVPLSKLFDDKWLNKTSKHKDIINELDSKIAKIKDDIITIEAIGTDVDLLKSLYLDTLNLNSTIQYANTLKSNRETATQEAEARLGTSPEAPTVEAEAEETPEELFNQEPTHTEAKEVPVTEPAKIELMVITMKVKGTYDQMVSLGDFMNANSITFEKISNE